MDWYIGNTWQLESKGLGKVVLNINFEKLEKPSRLSNVIIKVEEVKNLNGRPSKYLAAEYEGKENTLEMGTALTPIDCYVEILVNQMIVGERSQCYIRTRNANEITFIISVLKIFDVRDIHKLNVKEMYELASRYKLNGVMMFKDFPIWAHEYFVCAAKCIISYKPFDNIDENRDGISNHVVQKLLIQIQTNLAASLLECERYEDVINITEFVENQGQPTEKSIYRRALAYYNIKEFSKAQKTIEKVANFQQKQHFAQLHASIIKSWKTSNDHYKHVVQRMFT